VIAESPIISNFLISRLSYDPGDVMNIGIHLEEQISPNLFQPILGATVASEILRPDGQVDNLTLYDDGVHNDFGADDGVYANNYSNTDKLGSYLIKVTAHGSFERQLQETVQVGPFDAIYIAGGSLTPTPGSETEDRQPVISAVIFGPAGNINVDSISLKIDGNTVLSPGAIPIASTWVLTE
jgi:hypothetical protein